MVTSPTSPSRGLLRDCENRWIVCSSSLFPWLTWLRRLLLVTWIPCHPSPISPGTRTIHDMGSRDFHNNKSCVFLWCRFWPSHQDVNPAPFTTHIGSRAKGDLHKTLSWNIITIYWHYAFKSTPNIGKDSQHQTLPQMCPIKQEFINKLKTLTTN